MMKVFCVRKDISDVCCNKLSLLDAPDFIECKGGRVYAVYTLTAKVTGGA